MVSIAALLILLALLTPLPPGQQPDQAADLGRRLDEWVPRDSGYWGQD